MSTISSSSFRRGFKTWAENTSLSYRNRLRTRATAPLDMFKLAKHLGVRIFDPRKIPIASESLAYLTSQQGNDWSAFTVCLGNRHGVVINPSHSRERRASNIAHELSHIILGHKAAHLYIDPRIFIMMRNFDKIQEEEAAWLSGCLLLPRSALLYIAHCGWSDEYVTNLYVVSQQMLDYRRHASGTNKQMARQRAISQ